jgi:hypothetical protein
MLMIHGTAETNARCLPFCERCLAGACVAPNECQCNPGYRGEDCSLGEYKVDLPFVNSPSSRRLVYSRIQHSGSEMYSIEYSSELELSPKRSSID